MKTATRLTLLLVLAVLAGCNLLTPKTYELEQIHQTYTSEWAAATLPSTKVPPENKDGEGKFKNTLDLIRNYKLKYGKDTREAAHLTVLTGMIYLQSGAPGMAALLEDDVETAKGQLMSSGGVATRDFLIAENYPDLIKGWKAALGPSAVVADYTAPAKDIADRLAAVESRAAADVDSGGAYVAASAAIFYWWAGEVDRNQQKEMAKKGLEVLSPWMSPEEIAAAKDGSYEHQPWGGRHRYLDLYAKLEKRAGP